MKFKRISDKIPDKKNRYLLYWICFCLLAALIGAAVPVKEMRSLGLEGANQANLRSATGELTEGHELTFTLTPPTDTARQIGFFFTVNGHAFEEGALRLLVFDGDILIGGKEFPLKELTEDGFLFAGFDYTPEVLTVRMTCDAAEEGPSVWLNETTATPGSASIDGIFTEKSLVYNLIYTVSVHRVQKPLCTGLILFLAGLGVYGAGGFSLVEYRKRRSSRVKLPHRPGSRRKQLAALGCTVSIIALLFFYLYDTQIRIAQNTTEKAAVLKADGESVPVTAKNARVSQTVYPKEDKLTGLGVRVRIPEGTVLEGGSMHASVTDVTLGQVLCETDIAASQFISGEYVGLLFENSQEGVREHEYRIDLSFSEELLDSGLELMTSGDDLCVNAYLYFNIFLKRFFFFLFLAVEAFACLFWYLTFVRKVRIENVFLATVLFLGLVYNVMLTPQMVPDEAKHMDMAYRYSNGLLGFESLGDDKCLMRAEDAAVRESFTSSPSFGNYRNIYYGLFSRVQDDTMVEAEVSSNIEGSFLLYAPAVLGMSAARLLGLGPVPMLLLARYLNLAVFALLAWFGMRLLPFGKTTLFVLALFPVNMQQCTSFSHDAMVHGILFFYCCLCIRAVFSEERLMGEQVALMELTALFLLYCKGGSYFPLCFLPVLIPAARCGGRKGKCLIMSALLGIPALVFLMKQMGTVAGIVNTTAATSVVSVGDGSEYLTGYTVGYFLKDPLKFVYMMANTVFDKIGFYLESMVGYKLGWVEIETSMLVVILFLFLLFLANLDSREDTDVIYISPVQRSAMILLCLGCTGLILLGMLFSWTPMGHVSVEGVQGRYFLPFLPILMTACRSRGILLSRRIDRGIAAAAVSGQLLTLVYLMKAVLIV